MPHSRHLIAALVLAPLVGCCAQLIPNTDVPDSPENRKLISFCEQYRKAVSRKDVAELIKLASPDYYEDGGNVDASDDIDYAGLEEYLTDRFQDARAIRLLAAQAGERAQRVGKGELGTLDVGVYGSSLLNVVPRLLARFSETHPEVDVNIVLHNAHQRQQIDALRQRRILIAFDRFLPDDPDRTIEVVTEEPLLVALNAAHPLAANKTIDMGQLRNELLLLPAGIDSHIGRKLLQLCKDHGFDPQVLPGGGDVITTVAMIAIRADAGLSLIPGSMASLTMPNVAYRPLTARGKASVELHCLYRKDEQSPLLAALLRTVREYRQAGSIGACDPP